MRRKRKGERMGMGEKRRMLSEMERMRLVKARRSVLLKEDWVY